MSGTHPADTVLAVHYERVYEQLQIEAEMYDALANSAVINPDLGTFGPQQHSILTRLYEQAARELFALAEEAQVMARTYRSTEPVWAPAQRPASA